MNKKQVLFLNKMEGQPTVRQLVKETIQALPVPDCPTAVATDPTPTLSNNDVHALIIRSQLDELINKSLTYMGKISEAVKIERRLLTELNHHQSRLAELRRKQLKVTVAMEKRREEIRKCGSAIIPPVATGTFDANSDDEEKE
jgi:hypothetical protein